MATINLDKTITYDNKYSNYTLDADGNKISKSGWDLYEYLVGSGDIKQMTVSGTVVDAKTIFGMDIVVTGTKGKDWQTDKTFKIENTSESHATNFSNFDVDKPEIPKETGYYYGVSGCNAFATKHNYKNGYCLIVADKLKYYNHSLQCTKEELAEILYDGHLKYFFILKDKEMVFVDGNGNPLAYDYYSGEISTKHPYFLGYKNASKTAKPIVFPVDVGMDTDLINNLTILNSFYCVDDSTTLVSNKKSVVKGVRIECEFLKNPEGIPSIVCFNGTNPLPDKSTWLTGNFIFEVPDGVTDVIIQCQCDYENTKITTYMPEVLLAAAYKTNASGDSYPINYILHTDIIKEKEILLEGVPSYGDKYENNYIVQSGVKKIWITSKSSGNVSLKLNTKKKAGIINYYDKDETYLPKNAGSVESVAYAVLYNRIKLLENSNSRVQYKNLIGSPTKLSQFINDCNYATIKNIGGTTINASNEWGDLVNKPSWITMKMPSAEYFGGVPTSRKINGKPLTEDITIEVGGGTSDVLKFLSLSSILPDTINIKDFFIDKKIIFNTVYSGGTDIETDASGNTISVINSANTAYFEWDSTNSALSFNGNLYATGGISALGKLDVSGYTPVIIYDGLDGNDSKVALAATQGKVLDTRIKYLENNTVTTLPWSGITGKPSWIINAGNSKPTYTVGEISGAVPNTLTINGIPLDGDITLPWSGITGKPSWIINAGNSKPTYTVGEISGAVPNTLTINGIPLTEDITIQTGDPSKITDENYTLTTTGGTIGGDVQIHGNLLLKKGDTTFGCKLRFGDALCCYLYEDADDHLKIHADNGIALEYIDKIYFNKNVTESDYFQYDSTNGALKYNGSFYATGGISSMGFQTSTAGDVTATKITANSINISGCTISNDNITFKNGGYVDNTESGKLNFCGGNNNYVVTIDNQGLTTIHLAVSGDELYYSNNIKVSSQFDVIKGAFNTYSTLSEIKEYITKNLK